MLHYHNAHTVPSTNSERKEAIALQNACDVWASLFLMLSEVCPGHLPIAKNGALTTANEIMQSNKNMIDMLMHNGVQKADILSAIPESAYCFSPAIA